MSALDAMLPSRPLRLVAHHAHTEAGLIAGQRAHCPVLAATPLLCTVRLARITYPELATHRLDAVLKLLGMPIPAGRHQAMPDADATAQVFQRIIADGLAQGRWSSLRQLDAAGRVNPRSRAPSDGTGSGGTQETLF